MTYKNPAKNVLTKHNPENINEEPTDVNQNTDEEQNSAVNGSTSESLEGKARVMLFFLGSLVVLSFSTVLHVYT